MFGTPPPPKQAEELKPEEQEEEDGIPVPPGYTSNATDFSTPAGRKLIHQRMEYLGKSITFTPLITSVGACLMLFFMGRSVTMGMNNLWGLIKSGFGAITAAMAANHRLTITNRFVMVAIGGGLILFAVWRASKMGLIGPDDDYVPPERPPMLFDVE